MVLSINATSNSLNSQQSFGLQTNKIKKAAMGLASGLALRSAKDNAAGLVKAQGLRKEIRAISAATKNSGQAISLLDTADAGLSVVGDNLQRVRELVVQASSGTLGDEERGALQAEIDSELQNINDIASSSKFNDINLLNGSGGAVTIQTGTEDGQTTSIDLSGDFASNAAAVAGSINEGNTGAGNGTALDAIDVQANTSDTDYADALSGIDNAIANVSAQRSELGVKSSTLQANIDAYNVKSSNLQDAKSRIEDTDYAKEASLYIQASIQGRVSAGLASQSDLSSDIVLSLLP